MNKLDPGVVSVQDSRVLMGTIINITLIAENRKAGEEAVNRSFQEMERLVAIFDHHNSDSLLSRLNQEGELYDAPSEMLQVINQALSYSEMTGGAFDITIKPLVDLYRSYLANSMGLPAKKAVEGVLDLIDYRRVVINGSTIELAKPGMEITLDGIAKGYIIDQEIQLLKRLGYQNVLAEAGGDLYSSGVNENRSPWRIAVKPPRKTLAGFITKFEVQDQGIATSGDYFQSFIEDFSQHHILDPRTGYSNQELASATVIGKSAVICDGLATALMVIGATDGINLVEGLPGVEAYLVRKNMEIIQTTGMHKYSA
ncbi:MAG: FAD:protein FMN transferase [Dehalobacter sp.]|nr:FAD:protein FMN transferase [Dehalobacter sp.]